MRPLIERVLALEPHRAALVVGEEVTSFSALLDLVDHAAGVLAAAGIRPGDRIALVEEAGLHAVVALLAAMECGAAAALMNPRLTAHELAVLCEAAEVAPLGIAAEEHAATLIEAGVGSVLTAAVLLAGGPLRPEGLGGPVPQAAAVVLFTSGTTGTPKAIPMTHKMVTDRVIFYAPEADAEASVTLACTPFVHIGGMLPVLNSLAKGATTVIQRRFEAGDWLDLVERHGVNSTFVVPTMLHRIVAHPALAETDLGSMAMLAFGAAPASVELIRRVQAAFPSAILVNTFGQTETMGSLTLFDPAEQSAERLASVGQPMPGVEARVVDPALGTDVATGEVGELWVRTPTMAIPSEQLTDPILPTGWFRTGDLVRQDAEGYLYPVGRRSDTINRGGEKFPPSEVEDVIRLHPAVADAAVVGLADEELGMRVGVAAVLSSPVSLDELRSFCAASLAPYKLPERLVVFDELPYNDFGKVDRKVIRARAGAD